LLPERIHLPASALMSEIVPVEAVLSAMTPEIVLLSVLAPPRVRERFAVEFPTRELNAPVVEKISPAPPLTPLAFTVALPVAETVFPILIFLLVVSPEPV